MDLKMKTIIVVFSLFLSNITYADGEMSKTEIDQLFKELTSNPKSTWLKAGTIEATKEEYRAAKVSDERLVSSAISECINEYINNDNKAEVAEYLQKQALDAIPFNVRYSLTNEYTMRTTYIIKFEDDKYYCDITVDSREDSVKKPDELKANYRTEEFNMDWNGKRIMCNNGAESILYTPSVNNASIEPVDRIPSGTISLLNSGLIPWGRGNFTYEKLVKSTYSAYEEVNDGLLEIHLKIIDSSGNEHLIVLDPKKGYAPLSWIVNSSFSTTVNLYDEYKLVSGSWVPASIVVEQFEKKTDRLLSSDFIYFTKIEGETPVSTSFKVDFVPNTFIQLTYDITKPQLNYYYSNIANTDLLLAERKAYLESERVQNCATSALQYAALQLGKDILNQQLSELVDPENQTTSLEELEKYAVREGFYCKSVITDIQTLKKMSSCKAILHIPGKNHYVLLDHIDDQYVWIIDLTKNNFYYRTDINFFGMDWTEGAALLISNQPIYLPKEASIIPDDQLIGYIGGSGYDCNDIIQNSSVVHCKDIGYGCYDWYHLIYKMYRCNLSGSGSCTEKYMISKRSWPCRIGTNGCYLPIEEQIIQYTLGCGYN